MVEMVKKILDKSAEEGVDISVSYKMLVNEGADEAALKKAAEVLDTGYEAITYCYKNGDSENLERAVALAEAKAHDELRALLEKVRGE